MKRLVVKKPINLTQAELYSCYRLSLGSNGMLNSWLIAARNNRDSSKVLLYKIDGQVVSWGLRRGDGKIGIYTSKAHRQKGYATKVVSRAARLGKIKAYPHDEAGEKLYSKVNCEIG